MKLKGKGSQNYICISSERIWSTIHQNMSSGVSRHKPACAATEASWSLEISAIESIDIILSKQRTTKALIRLRECADWSAPLLFAYDRRHVFSCPGSYGKLNILMQISSKFWRYCDFMFSKWLPIEAAILKLSLKLNYETQFISQKHAYTYTFDTYNLCFFSVL